MAAMTRLRVVCLQRCDQFLKLFLDGYLMNDNEIKFKTSMWMKMNADYLKGKAEKEEKERVLREEAEREGKPFKKKGPYKKKPKAEKGHNQTALEGILQNHSCLGLEVRLGRNVV